MQFLGYWTGQGESSWYIWAWLLLLRTCLPNLSNGSLLYYTPHRGLLCYHAIVLPSPTTQQTTLFGTSCLSPSLYVFLSPSLPLGMSLFVCLFVYSYHYWKLSCMQAGLCSWCFLVCHQDQNVCYRKQLLSNEWINVCESCGWVCACIKPCEAPIHNPLWWLSLLSDY